MKRTIAEHNAMASVYDNPAYLADLDADIAKSQSSQAFVALAPDAKNTVGFVSHDWPECEVSEIPPNAGNDRAASFSPIAQTNLPKPTNLLKPTAPAKINKPSKISVNTITSLKALAQKEANASTTPTNSAPSNAPG